MSSGHVFESGHILKCYIWRNLQCFKTDYIPLHFHCYDFSKFSSKTGFIASGSHYWRLTIVPAATQRQSGETMTSVSTGHIIHWHILKCYIWRNLQCFKTDYIPLHPHHQALSRAVPITDVWHCACCHTATEWGDHDFCLNRSHYTDIDSTNRERAPGAAVEPKEVG